MGWVNTVDEWINEMEWVLKCSQKALEETKNWNKEKKKLKGVKNRIIVNIWLIRVLKEKLNIWRTANWHCATIKERLNGYQHEREKGK